MGYCFVSSSGITVIKLSSRLSYSYSKIVQSEQSIYLIQFSHWLSFLVLVQTHAQPQDMIFTEPIKPFIWHTSNSK